MPEEVQLESSAVPVLPEEPIYFIGLGKSEMLRLSAYGVLLAFLAAGAFSALASSAQPRFGLERLVTPGDVCGDLLQRCGRP